MGYPKTDTADIRAIRTTLQNIRLHGARPCKMLSSLKGQTPEQIYRYANGQEIHWLGVALVQLGILNPPFIAREDVMGCEKRWREARKVLSERITSMPVPRYYRMKWYWPFEELLWGCHQFADRFRRYGFNAYPGLDPKGDLF